MDPFLEEDDRLARLLFQYAQIEKKRFFDWKETNTEKALACAHRYVLAIAQPIAMLGVMTDPEFDQALFEIGKKNAPRLNRAQNISESRKLVAVSTLYNIGGHTRCVEFLIKSTPNYDWQIVESAYDGSSLYKAKETLSRLDSIKISSVQWGQGWIDQASRITEQIIKSGCSSLFLFVHPDDIVWPIVLGMLSETGSLQTKTYFYDHADHRFSVARGLCQYYIAFRSVSLAQAKRAGAKNIIVIPLAASAYQTNKPTKDSPSLPEKYTFAASYTTKIMIDPHLTFFHLIARGLKNNPQYSHVQMTTMTEEEKGRIREIFRQYQVDPGRIIIVPNTHEWRPYVQDCDLVLCTYPLGSGVLVQDLAKQNKPFLAFGPIHHRNWQINSDNAYIRNWIAHDEDEWLEKLSLLLNDRRLAQMQCQKVQQYHEAERIKVLWQHLLEVGLTPVEEPFSDWDFHPHAFRKTSLTICQGYTWIYSCIEHPFSRLNFISKLSWFYSFPSNVFIGWIKNKYINNTFIKRLTKSVKKRLDRFKRAI